MVDVFTVLSCMKMDWLRRLMLEDSSFGDTVFKTFHLLEQAKSAWGVNFQMCQCSGYVPLSGGMF